MGTIAMLLTVLGTDVFPAISIAYEKGEADIMKLKPRNPRKQLLVTPELLSYTYGQTAIIECIAGFFAYFVTYAQSGWLPQDLLGVEKRWHSRAVNDLEDSYGQEWSYSARQELSVAAQTAFFVAIVITQLGNIICCKSKRISLLQKKMINKKMNCAIIFAIGLAIALVYVPGLNSAVNLISLSPEVWLAPLPFAVYLIIYDEIRKLIIRNFPTSMLGKFLNT